MRLTLSPSLEETESDLEVKMVHRSCTTMGKRIEEGIQDGSINWIKEFASQALAEKAGDPSEVLLNYFTMDKGSRRCETKEKNSGCPEVGD
jgi:hypothetical protein